LPSHQQGTGLPIAEASESAPIVRSSLVVCANSVRSNGLPPVALVGVSGRFSIFDVCPMCGVQPVEPVRVDGQLACRACTTACIVCGDPSVPGDDACAECLRLVDGARQLVSL